MICAWTERFARLEEGLMRRIKAIYLIPVCLVLLIGAAVASYYFLFKPQLEKVDQARKAWEAARAACAQEEGDYQKALDEQVVYAKQIFYDYHEFQEIQKTMPAVYNMKERFAGKEKEGIYEWYRIMGEGRMIRELNRWVRSFHQPSAPTFTYSGTMGYENTLPSAKMVSVDFGSMKFSKRGLGNLLNSLRRVTGHNYFPMIISLPGDTATIQLDLARDNPAHDPNNPLLSLSYSATAYFLTQGWDPQGPGAAAAIEKYKQMALTKKQAKPHRTGWNEAPGEMTECPPVLFFIQQQGLQH